MTIKKLALLGVIASLCVVGLTFAQTPTPPEPFPPNGFYLALADVNARIGQQISLVCSNPTDGASCAMSDIRLNWEWSLQSYPSGALDCPDPAATYPVQTTSAYTYRFTWQEVVYDYRQYAFGGEPPFLCTSTGREALLPPGSNPAVPSGSDTPVVVGLPTSAAPGFTDCPLPPRLVVNNNGRVTPGEANNLRAQPGLTQAYVGQIPGGETFRVMGGPVCVDGIVWWQVQYQLSIGWTGEGKDGQYWVEPLANTAPPATALILPTDRPLIDARNSARLERATTLSGSAPLATSGYGLLALTANAGTGAQVVWVYDVGNAPDPKLLNINGTVLALAFSPTFDQNAALLGILVQDGTGLTLQLWDAFLGVERYRVTVANGFALTFSPDGKLLALATPTDVQLLDALSGQFIAQLPLEAHPGAIAFSPDGALLATGNGAAVVLWDVATRSRSTVISAQMNPTVGVLQFSPDGNLLAVGSATAPDANGNSQYYVALWDMTTRVQARNIPAEAMVSSLDFSPDGLLLALAQTGVQSASGKESIRIFEVATATPVGQVVPLEPGYLSEVNFSADGSLLIFANRAFSTGSLRVEVFGVTQ